MSADHSVNVLLIVSGGGENIWRLPTVRMKNAYTYRYHRTRIPNHAAAYGTINGDRAGCSKRETTAVREQGSLAPWLLCNADELNDYNVETSSSSSLPATPPRVTVQRNASGCIVVAFADDVSSTPQRCATSGAGGGGRGTHHIIIMYVPARASTAQV